MKTKYELTKGDMVKRTKSEALVKLLVENGWKLKTSGGDKKEKA